MLLIWKILWPGISPIWKLFKTLVALWVWRKNTCASCPWISHHLSSNGFATWSWRRRWNWFLGWAGGEMGIMSSYSSTGPSNRFFAGMDISWCSWDPIYDPLMHLGVGFTSQGSYTIMFPQKALIEYWVYNKMILQLGNLPTAIRFWEPYILLHITKKNNPTNPGFLLDPVTLEPHSIVQYVFKTWDINFNFWMLLGNSVNTYFTFFCG